MKPLPFFTCVLALASLAGAADKKETPTWTDPAVAAAENPDFLIQGEYGSAAPGADWGVQVFALGDGKFDAFILEGGLPGVGYTREKLRIKLTGTASALSADGWKASIADGQITVEKDGAEAVSLPRIERASDTLGKAAPAGAIVLFDGRAAEKWRNETVIDGLLKNTDPITQQEFGSYQLHLEFRTPFKPFARGQARGNSGVYHQGRYETQVLDSFALEGADNETGGVYKTGKPIVNACLPPLAWQTYDIDFTAAQFNAAGEKTANARMTVHLNGVLVQDNLDIPAPTGGSKKKEDGTPGPIYLQSHGNPIFYRNIWLVEK